MSAEHAWYAASCGRSTPARAGAGSKSSQQLANSSLAPDALSSENVQTAERLTDVKVGYGYGRALFGLPPGGQAFENAVPTA